MHDYSKANWHCLQYVAAHSGLSNFHFGPNLVKLLTVDCKDITGGILNVEKDSVKASDAILSHIESKRKKLGI